MLLNRFHYESPDGKIYYFGKMIQSHSNLGIPAVKFIEDSGPQQHGVNIRDWRISPRTISLELFKEGQNCCDTRGEMLAKLIDAIRPNRGVSADIPGWLRFVNDNWQMVEIPVHVLRGPTGDYSYAGSISRRQIQDSIQFYAADPIWREKERQSIIVDGQNWGNSCLSTSQWYLDQGYTLDSGYNLDFGIFNSCLFSCVIQDNNLNSLCLVPYTYIMQTFDILYTGTWSGDQIDITLTGPMSQPTITNDTTGKQIQLNYNISNGEYVIITIRPEYATVTNNFGQNLIGTVTSISDLVDFELVTAGQISSNGLNTITIAALDSNLETTQIKIDYYIRHISAYGNPQCEEVTVGQEIAYDIC